MLAPVKDVTSLRAALIFGCLAVFFRFGHTHIHTHKDKELELGEDKDVRLLLMVLIVVAIWIHRSAGTGCSYAHTGICLRDGSDDIRVAPAKRFG